MMKKNNMKKYLIMCLVLSFAFSIIIGCGGGQVKVKAKASAKTEAPPPPPPEPEVVEKAPEEDPNKKKADELMMQGKELYNQGDTKVKGIEGSEGKVDEGIADYKDAEKKKEKAEKGKKDSSKKKDSKKEDKKESEDEDEFAEDDMTIGMLSYNKVNYAGFKTNEINYFAESKEDKLERIRAKIRSYEEAREKFVESKGKFQEALELDPNNIDAPTWIQKADEQIAYIDGELAKLRQQEQNLINQPDELEPLPKARYIYNFTGDSNSARFELSDPNRKFDYYNEFEGINKKGSDNGTTDFTGINDITNGEDNKNLGQAALLYNEGKNYLIKKDYDNAANKFEEAIAITDAPPKGLSQEKKRDASYNLGLIYKIKGYKQLQNQKGKNNNLAKAENQFKQAIDLDRLYVKPYIQLAEINYKLTNYDQSEDFCKKGLALDRNNAHLLFKTGEIYLDKSKDKKRYC